MSVTRSSNRSKRLTLPAAAENSLDIDSCNTEVICEAQRVQQQQQQAQTEQPATETIASRTYTRLHARRLKHPRAKLNSALWAHFEECTTDRTSSICKVETSPGVMCGCRIRRPQGSTTGMKRHFKSRHPEQFKLYLFNKIQNLTKNGIASQDINEFKKLQAEQEQSASKPTKSHHIKKQCCTQSRSSPHENRSTSAPLDDSSGRCIVPKAESSTLKFIEALDPYANVKHSSVFRNHLCDLLYRSVKEAVDAELNADLPQVSGICLTADSHPSEWGDKHELITLHYIVTDTDNRFRLRKFCLACPNFNEQLSAETVPVVLNKIVTDMMNASLSEHIPKYLVVDENSSLIQDVAWFRKIHVQSPIVYFGHILSAAVRLNIVVGELGVLLDKCKKLSLILSRSPEHTKKLQNACRLRNIPFKRIPQPAAAGLEWNTIVKSLRAIVDLKDALLWWKTKEPLSAFSSSIPTEENFDWLRELLIALKILSDCYETLARPNQPTIHLVTTSLLLISKIPKGTSTIVQRFVEAIQHEINEKVPNLGRAIEVYNLGNFLHPKYKGRLLSIGGDRVTLEKTIEAVRKRFREDVECLEYDEKLSSQSRLESMLSRAMCNNSTSSSIWDAVDEAAVAENLMELNGSRNAVRKPAIDVEIERYIREYPQVDETELDILAYWSNQQSDLPKLTQLAREILCIPTTNSSVFESSSDFSCASNLSANICEEKIEKMLFIRQNYDRLSHRILATDFGDDQYEGPKGKLPDHTDCGQDEQMATDGDGVVKSELELPTEAVSRASTARNSDIMEFNSESTPRNCDTLPPQRQVAEGSCEGAEILHGNGEQMNVDDIYKCLLTVGAIPQS
ncbi:unnamed protein product [Anisakis simplex]|uniref:BED-type domain-containing protein n=1 Tax=Anisakis simplex TaxID=6269 RepID=A0A0M3K0S7_ANISI|nr:unnamed protein product [Anisakis simplex]